MSSVQQNVIKHKLGLLNLAVELGNVSKACKVMGFSRDTFYRYQSAVEDGGVEALLDANRRKPNPKNRVEESVEEAVIAFNRLLVRYEYPTNYDSEASLFHLLAYALSGYGMIWNHSGNACPHWKNMLLKQALF